MIARLDSMFDVLAVLGLVLKVTSILAGGALIAALARRRPAATRHFVWLMALSSTLALVALAPVAPRLKIRVPAPAGLEAPRAASSAGPSEAAGTPGNTSADVEGAAAGAATTTGHGPTRAQGPGIV